MSTKQKKGGHAPCSRYKPKKILQIEILIRLIFCALCKYTYEKSRVFFIFRYHLLDYRVFHQFFFSVNKFFNFILNCHKDRILQIKIVDIFSYLFTITPYDILLLLRLLTDVLFWQVRRTKNVAHKTWEILFFFKNPNLSLLFLVTKAVFSLHWWDLEEFSWGPRAT